MKGMYCKERYDNVRWYKAVYGGKQMIINVEKKSDNALENILESILSLDENNFKRATQTVDWEEDNGLDFYYDDTKIEIPISIIFKYLDKSAKKFDINSEQYKRITEIVESRNEEKLYRIATEKAKDIEPYEYLMVKKFFEMLSNDELFDKFKDFENNKECFACPYALAEKSKHIENYFKILRNIFGSLGEDGSLINTCSFLDDFYIPNVEEYKKKCIELYNIFERQIQNEAEKSKYKFEAKKNDIKDTIIEYEPEWELNNDIKMDILDGMPDDLSLEEKALYIYTKMCKMFAYDEGYLYRDKDKGEKINYTFKFSKEHLEGLTPDSKITCFDFARVYKKMMDGLDEKIDTVIFSQGGHFYTGFSTEDCQAVLEAINLIDANDLRANDLARAKANLSLEGIKFVSGEQEKLSNAVEKISSILLKDQQRSTMEYMEELMEMQVNEEFEESTINSMDLLRSLIKNMKKLQISGNEFTMFLNNAFNRFGILSENIERSFVGKVIKQDESTNNYERMIWFKEKKTGEKGSNAMYILETSSLELSGVSDLEMLYKFANGDIVYENEKRQMNGFEIT